VPLQKIDSRRQYGAMDEVARHCCIAASGRNGRHPLDIG
jgi:hypothetical protein